jgi:hypothetical protein
MMKNAELNLDIAAISKKCGTFLSNVLLLDLNSTLKFKNSSVVQEKVNAYD